MRIDLKENTTVIIKDKDKNVVDRFQLKNAMTTTSGRGKNAVLILEFFK